MNKQTDGATAAHDFPPAAIATVLHLRDGVDHPQTYQTSNPKSPKNQTLTPQNQHPASP